MPIYHKRINGRKVWWVRVTHKALNASRVCQRGKSPDTIQRAGQTALTMEALLPELLAKPVGKIQDADVCVFWATMAREGRRVVERIAGERRSRPSWCVARRRYIVRSEQWECASSGREA